MIPESSPGFGGELYTARMAERYVQLVNGARYFAGVDLPFIVPRSVVTGAAEDLGFTDIQWYDRDEHSPPLDPKTADPQYYSDDWDEWATGVYRGVTRVERLSHAPTWIAMQQPVVPVVQPTQSTVPVQQRTAKAPPEPTAEQLGTAGSVPARIQQIVNQALASGDPDYVRETAEALKAGGWDTLAEELGKTVKTLALRLVEASKKPSNWPLFVLADVVFYGGAALLLKKRRRA